MKKGILKILIATIIFLIGIGAVNAIECNSTDDVISFDQSDEIAVSDNGSDLVGIEDSDEVLIVENASNEIIAQNNDVEILSLSDNPSSYMEIEETATISDRTFKIGKYSVTISKTRFANLYTARDVEDYYWYQGGPDAFYYGDKIGDFTCGSEGVYYEFKAYTNKYVKQKLGFGYKGDKLKKLKAFKSKSKALKYKKKLKNKYTLKIKKKNGRYVVYKVVPQFKKVITKKARVFIIFAYGACQCGVGSYKYTMSLGTKYQNPGYEIIKGWVSKYKVSSSLFGLKTARVRSW